MFLSLFESRAPASPFTNCELSCKAATVIAVMANHIPPQIGIESHYIVNLCSVFYLKAYFWLYRMMYPLFLVNKDSTYQYFLKRFLLG